MKSELDLIKAEYSNYSVVVEKIGIKRIENRFEKLLSIMNSFIIQLNVNHIFYVNQRLLLIAVLDFFSDIMRLREFHNIQEINEFKMKAYESAWILRRKPIQIKTEKITAENDYINEQFIYNYLIAFLLDGKNINKEEIFSEMLSFFDSLFYYLKFRDCEPRAIELFLLSFKSGERLGSILQG